MTHYGHDDGSRDVPEFTTASPGWLEGVWLGIKRRLGVRDASDAKQAKAARDNAAARAAEAASKSEPPK
jgi:hypothetical protein